jgi:hypothetical protein
VNTEERPPLNVLQRYSGHTGLFDFVTRQPEGRWFVSMSQGQWDDVHAEAYQAGAVLVEVNDDENAVATYRRADSP